jgi:hypothetical protein
MKKYLIIALVLAVVLAGTITIAKDSANVMKKAVTVDGKTRTAIMWVDQDGLHIQYFSDDSHGMILLGEEVFKDGQKVFDNYRENDGLRPMN